MSLLSTKSAESQGFVFWVSLKYHYAQNSVKVQLGKVLLVLIFLVFLHFSAVIALDEFTSYFLLTPSKRQQQQHFTQLSNCASKKGAASRDLLLTLAEEAALPPRLTAQQEILPFA